MQNSRLRSLPPVLILCLLVGGVLPPASADDSPRTAPPKTPTAVERLDPATPWPLADRDSDAPQLVPSDRPYWRRNFFKRVATDQSYLVRTWWPAELRNPLFSAPLAVSLGIAVSSGGPEPGIDDRAELYVGRWLRGRYSGPARTVSMLGDTETAVLAIGGSYLISKLTHNDRFGETTSLTAEAVLDAALWNVALKSLTSRSRPGSGPNGQIFVYGTATNGSQSFPSGHAMGAFAAAAVIAGQHRDRKWVPWLAYGTASMIAGSRVALGRHYLSDVVAGSILGRSVGKMVVSRAAGERPKLRRSQSWAPIVDPLNHSYGATYSTSW